MNLYVDKLVALSFLCLISFLGALSHSVYAIDLEAKSISGYDAESPIFGVVVKSSSVFSAEQLLNSYFDLIGKPASKENLRKLQSNIINLYRDHNYFSPTIQIKKNLQHPKIYQVIVSEPVLLGFEVTGGDSETRARAISFLNSLLGGAIANKKTFEYLEASLEGRLNVGIDIMHLPLDSKNNGFSILVKIVGSINSQLTVSNEGTSRLGREIISAQLQFSKKIPGFNLVYISTYNTLKSDGYRSVGAGFNSDLSKNNELIFEVNLSRGRYENLIDNTIPDVVYDRRFILLGWQYQPKGSNLFSNAFFTSLKLNDFDREQYLLDFEEKLRSAELGYWQQNVWKNNALFWQLNAEKGLDSVGAKLEGPLADANIEIDYSVIRARLAFNQNLPWDIGIRTDIQGQYTSDYVPFSQRFTISNDSLARAFESGEVNGDSGIGFKVEMSKGDDLALLSSRLVPYGYYSLGKVRDNFSTESVTAGSIGLGLRWFNRHLFSYVEIGKPLEEYSRYRTNTPRIRASMRLLF
ncbi:MAG: ShlB/FhaC/HecB family hemolysin secretion/activation protein [Cellvibrionaceae bacterium]